MPSLQPVSLMTKLNSVPLWESGITEARSAFLRNRPNWPTRKCEPLPALKRELSPLYPFLQHAFTHFLEIGMFLDV